MLRLLALVTLLGFAAPAFADPETGAAHTTIAIQPIMLVAAFVDASVEHQVAPHVGVVAIGGLGFPITGATLYELGAQGNVYLFHAFRGVHLGTEVKYLWGSSHFGLLGGPQASSFVTERVLGAYVGYKWIAAHQITAELQVGVGRLELSGTTTTAMTEIIPVANLAAGWSF